MMVGILRHYDEIGTANGNKGTHNRISREKNSHGGGGGGGLLPYMGYIGMCRCESFKQLTLV